MMTQREQERAFELLRTELGANPIEVRDERTGRILWRKSQLTGCVYDSSGIDSKSQNNNGRSKEISDDGRV
jgi:hypothetical protein